MPKAKRARTDKGIGAPTEDDLLTAQNASNHPSSSALSTRLPPSSKVPALTTLCARVFVANVVGLGKDEDAWGGVRLWLKALPEYLVPKIFAMLSVACPTRLRSDIIIPVSRATATPLS